MGKGETHHHQVVIIGGGTGGIAVAARLRKRPEGADVAIIEPSAAHYYQQLWTLVGAGAASWESTVRREEGLIPRGTRWIQEAVAEVDPDNNRLTTESGSRIEYDYLVVAAGVELNWGAIKGLEEGVVGRDGVCSNYAYETVGSTWETLRGFSGGTAVFTCPQMPIKCPGAPQKIAYLADDHFRRRGVRQRSEVVYASATDSIFGVEKYAATLRKVIERKGIQTRFGHNLVEVRPETREAVFERLDGGERATIHYGMLHVTPPQRAPEFVRSSKLVNEGGWVDVDKHTLRHPRYPNVFALGDVASLPTSKTAAAIRKQAPVLVENLAASVRQGAPAHRYDGYAACPIVTGYGKVVLAEFDYDKNIRESFPFDQAKERWSMWLVKKYGLPWFYWNVLLKGKEVPVGTRGAAREPFTPTAVEESRAG